MKLIAYLEERRAAEERAAAEKAEAERRAAEEKAEAERRAAKERDAAEKAKAKQRAAKKDKLLAVIECTALLVIIVLIVAKDYLYDLYLSSKEIDSTRLSFLEYYNDDLIYASLFDFENDDIPEMICLLQDEDDYDLCLVEEGATSTHCSATMNELYHIPWGIYESYSSGEKMYYIGLSNDRTTENGEDAGAIFFMM